MAVEHKSQQLHASILPSAALEDKKQHTASILYETHFYARELGGETVESSRLRLALLTLTLRCSLGACCEPNAVMRRVPCAVRRGRHAWL